MNKFQLRPTQCDKHKSADITYDGNVYERCPLCIFEESKADIEDLNDTISTLREENEDYEDEVNALKDKIERIYNED